MHAKERREPESDGCPGVGMENEEDMNKQTSIGVAEEWRRARKQKR